MDRDIYLFDYEKKTESEGIHPSILSSLSGSLIVPPDHGGVAPHRITSGFRPIRNTPSQPFSLLGSRGTGGALLVERG